MTATYQLPGGEVVAEFLGDLYGLTVTAADAATADVAISAVGVYVNEAGEVRGYVACDLPAAVKLGASLTQVPMGGVEDAIASGGVSENLAENLFEVLNISVNLFEGRDSARIVFDRLATDEAEVGPLTEQLKAGDCVAYTLNIQRYGDGKIVIATPA
jgi:hypothetical protein